MEHSTAIKKCDMYSFTQTYTNNYVYIKTIAIEYMSIHKHVYNYKAYTK